MNKNLNNIIKRKNYQNFIIDGVENMIYKLTNEQYDNVVNQIENDEINQRLGILKNQIGFFNNKNQPTINNSTLTEEDSKSIISDMNKINNSLDVLKFKKDSLQVNLDEHLSNMNISEAIKLKSKISDLEKQLGEYEERKNKLNNKIKDSVFDYELQMIKIREKYEDVDVVNSNFADESFSDKVIYEYKKERVRKLANQFLDSLTQNKKEQILNENESLRGFLNVGENI